MRKRRVNVWLLCMNFLQWKSPKLFCRLVISKQQVSRRLSPTVVIKFSRKSILSRRIMSFHCSWRCSEMLACVCSCCTSSQQCVGLGFDLILSWGSCVGAVKLMSVSSLGVYLRKQVFQNTLITPAINENQRLSSEDDECWTKLPIDVSLPVQMKACQKSY